MPGHLDPRVAHPELKVDHQRRHLVLPHDQALLRRPAVDRALGVEDGVDPPHRLGCQRRTTQLGQFKQLSPPVGPAASLHDRPRPASWRIQRGEPGIGIGLQDAGIPSQVLLRVLPSAIGRVIEQGSGRRRAAEWPVIAHVGPQSSGRRATFGLHRHGRVVAVQAGGRHHMRPDQGVQRRQVRRAGADPVGQGGGVEVDALAGKGLALPVQRQMLSELRLQDHRQQFGSGTAPRDRMERRRRLRDRLAGAAGKPLSHRLDHLPLPRDYFQRLGDVLAELGKLAVAARTGGRSGDHHPFSRQMRRQWPAHRLAANTGAARLAISVCLATRVEGCLVFGRGGFQLLELQFQLIQQLAAALGRGAEPLMPQLGDQQLQMRHHRLGTRRAGFGLAAR